MGRSGAAYSARVCLSLAVALGVSCARDRPTGELGRTSDLVGIAESAGALNMEGLILGTIFAVDAGTKRAFVVSMVPLRPSDVASTRISAPLNVSLRTGENVRCEKVTICYLKDPLDVARRKTSGFCRTAGTHLEFFVVHSAIYVGDLQSPIYETPAGDDTSMARREHNRSKPQPIPMFVKAIGVGYALGTDEVILHEYSIPDYDRLKFIR